MKRLWQIFFNTYAYLYYCAHAKDLKKIIRPEVEVWFYVKASEDRRLQCEKDTSLRISAELRKKNQHYAQLKKNDWIFSKELQALSGFAKFEFVQEHHDCLVTVSGVCAQGSLGLLYVQIH